MRFALAVAFALAACRPNPPLARIADPALPRLLPPPLLDPDTPGAPYLTAVALQLQPGWQQFLEDCRLRLPLHHPLNQMSLVASAELAIDPRGQVVALEISPSASPDFDRAIRQVVADAAPLPKPPRELWSDDDRVHLHWLFARDRRQAGPATASVVDVQLPVRAVIARLVAEGDLARAARRILRAPVDGNRAAGVRTVMVAALREGLTSADGAGRRAAIDAISAAGVAELLPDVTELVAVTGDVDLRLVALEHAIGASEQGLRLDLETQPRLALAEARALAATGEGAAAAAVLRAALEATTSPNPLALQALAFAPVADLAPSLATWFSQGDARTRGAVCGAAAGYPPSVAWPLIARGLADRDATVRAPCCDAARARAGGNVLRGVDERSESMGHGVDADDAIARKAAATALTRLHKLARDRDRAVRARAVLAIANLDRAHLVHAADDTAAEVRAAYAVALGVAQPSDAEPRLRGLLDDRDPDVRAAAWTSFRVISTSAVDRQQLATRAAHDSAPSVRSAVVPAIFDDDLLWQIVNTDDMPDLRTAAMVQLARIRTRDQLTNVLLERLAVAPVGSTERIRVAFAWLLAR